MTPPERPPVYADEDLDRLLVTALRQRGFDLLGTDEAGQRSASDQQQLAFATSLGGVLVTHTGWSMAPST